MQKERTTLDKDFNQNIYLQLLFLSNKLNRIVRVFLMRQMARQRRSNYGSRVKKGGMICSLKKLYRDSMLKECAI